MNTDPAVSGAVVDEDHILSADCPCGPEVVNADDVFNTFPEVTDEDLGRKAIALKAQLFQVVGELARRPLVPSNDPYAIDKGIGEVISLVMLEAYLSGNFADEHTALQVLIDNGGVWKATV